MLALLLLATSGLADEHRQRLTKIGEYNPDAQTVEMFAAIEKGDIAVKLIPKDSTQSNVLIENKTDQPLNVKLPDSFAGVPVLAQAAGAAGGSTHKSNSGNKNQSVGGGMMGGGGGMGMFSVPPETTGKFKVATVCLDEGKGEPHAAIPYEIQPIDRCTTKPGVRELCQMLGAGKLDQRAAQAAAWHLNNDMSWQQLAAKRLRYANGTSRPYFSQQEIQAAQQISAAAERTAKQRQEQTPTSHTSAIKSSG
jgi:hypothetical protein